MPRDCPRSLEVGQRTGQILGLRSTFPLREMSVLRVLEKRTDHPIVK